MKTITFQDIMNDWAVEIGQSLPDNDGFFLALFSHDQKLLYASKAMKDILKGFEPHLSLLNPSFDKLISLPTEQSLIFEGFLTIGDYSSLNTAIKARVYSKDKKLLIIGGIATRELMEQNKILLELNKEISNLQRQLIIEKQKLENTLKELTESKKENETKDNFFSIISHDLRSPIGSMMQLSEIISEQDSLDNETRKIFLETQKELSKNTFQLLDNLLNWARFNSNKIIFRPRRIRIKDIINNNIESISFQLIKKHILVDTNFSNEPFAFADEDMINLVIRNLLSNALKFTPSNGKIRIETIERKDVLSIRIINTGSGIDQQTIKKILSDDQFYTSPGTKDEKGSGLGLKLCMKFISMNRGELKIKSIRNKETTVSFTIPKTIK